MVPDAPGRLGDAPPPARARTAAAWLAPLAVVLLTAIAFSPSLRNGFVNWDDEINLVDNWAYRGLGPDQLEWMFTTFHMGHYQPLTWLTLGLDFRVWGMNPFGYHLTSVLFHIANALLFFFLAHRLLRFATRGSTDGGDENRLALSAAFAAGLFALHPLRVESVAWITERRDVVSVFFLFLSALAYIDAVTTSSRTRSSLALAASLAAFALALLGKAIAVVLPALLLVIDFYPLGRHRADGARAATSIPRLAIEKIPYALLSIAGIWLGIRAQQSAVAPLPDLAGFSLGARAATVLHALAFYIHKTLVPTHLSPAYVLPDGFGLTSPGLLASAALIAAAVTAVVRTRRPAWRAAGLAYLIALAPLSGVLQQFSFSTADRYSYLCCLGFALLGGGAFAAGFAGSALRRALSATVAVAILVSLGALTARQCRVWHDSETLWRHALRIDPRNPVALDNLAATLTDQRRWDEAKATLRRLLAARPDHAGGLSGMGVIALHEGDAEAALDYLRRSLDSRPRNAPALANVGVAHLQLRQNREAVDALQQAVRIRPHFFDGWQNLGSALLTLGRFDEAAEAYRRAIRLDPTSIDTRRTLVAVYLQNAEWSRLVGLLRDNLEWSPDDRESANALAWILATSVDASLRSGEEAVSLAERSLALCGDPPDAQLLDTYAAALAEAGRWPEAQQAAERAVGRAAEVGNAQLETEARARLELYRRQQPFRAESARRS